MAPMLAGLGMVGLRAAPRARLTGASYQPIATIRRCGLLHPMSDE